MSEVESKTYSDSFDCMNFALDIAGGTATTADTDITGGTYRPRRRPCVLRVTICLVTGSVFKAIINDGTDRTHEFQKGAPLVGDAVYTEDLPIGGGSTELTVDWQTDANDTISSFHVEEINEAV